MSDESAELRAQLKQMQEEMARLQAQLEGTGSIAQGEGAVAVTATDESIGVGGDVGGSIKTGDKVQGDKYEAQQMTFVGDPPPGAAAVRREQARLHYLRRLNQHCQIMALAALGAEEGADEDLTLDQVYIDLDTTALVPLTATEKKQQEERGGFGREADERRLTAIEAATRHARLVLLGDPGAGKSTFVRQLLGTLARAALGEGEPPARLSVDLLPVLVTLRDLAQRLSGIDCDQMGGTRQQQTLAAAVRDQILADLDVLEAPDFAEELRQILAGGHYLLVLDGLDEVPHHLRQKVRQAVVAIIRQYRAERIIVTCRIRSYVGEAQLPGFQAHTIAPFDADKIRNFARAWYTAQKKLGHITAAESDSKAADLTEAALSDELRELAENPMLLTTMVIIHQREIGLPRERVRLYSLAVDVLLRRWQKHKAGERGLSPSPALAEFLKDDHRLRPVLERLAYEAHQSGLQKKEAADLPRGEALVLLDAPEYLGKVSLAEEFLDYVDQRSGLLVGRGGELNRPTAYSFPHRTFQEYLAGCYLISQRQVARQIYDRAAEGDYWTLAVQLGAEELLYNLRRQHELLDLVYRLCPVDTPVTAQARRASLWAGSMAAILGRDTIERDTDSPDGGGPVYLARQILHLVDLLGSDLPPLERAEAGNVLARLGDPRPEVMTVDGMEFCAVPPGPFVLGSGDDDDRAYSYEKPQHVFTINDGYWLGRYPVTVAQWREFVTVSRHEPSHLESLRDPDNRPVRYVTWHEVVKFCHWLTEKWQGVGRLPAGWQVRLPGEAEWEKAARGGLKILSQPVIRVAGGEMATLIMASLQPNSLPQRRYPWGDEPDPNRANYDDTKIGITSAVGCFSQGKSVYGCEEMSGNVWEWCATKWQDDYKDYRNDNDLESSGRRVVRGGAFGFTLRLVRCACRGHLIPVSGFDNRGFRVMVSPFF